MHSSDYVALTHMRSDRNRSNHFYLQILPRKGRHAYRRLYECLKNERIHMGHRDLVSILDTALYAQSDTDEHDGDCQPKSSRKRSTSLVRKISEWKIIQEMKQGIRISLQLRSSSHMSTSVSEGAINMNSSQLQFTDDQRVASAMTLSSVQFSQSDLPPSLTSPSSVIESSSTQITLLSSVEGQSQPYPNVAKSTKSHHTSMTAEHEDILKRTVEKKMHIFIEQTHFDTLLPHLLMKKLVCPEEHKMLEKYSSWKEKGIHFYASILPRKGRHAKPYRQLYKCLKRETTHLGHRDLVEMLDRALEEQYSPQDSYDNIPTSTSCNPLLTKDDGSNDPLTSERFHGLCEYGSSSTNDADSHDHFKVPQVDNYSCIDSCLPNNSENKTLQNVTHQVPFLHYHVLECDHRGIEYIINDHDITLRIPEGAVPVGKSIKFEIGVIMYGPFGFPESTRPISPIVWLCIREEIELKKPFQLILPHFLIGLKKERLKYHRVSFAKASHSSYDATEKYKFNECASEVLFASTKDKSYGVLNSTHCCFYCLTSSNTPELARDAGYCLAQIETILSSQPQRSEIYFVAFFFLATCMKVVAIYYSK